MFSTSKTGPSPTTRTFAMAGTSCVWVTMTLTQFGRDWMMFKHFVDNDSHFWNTAGNSL